MATSPLRHEPAQEELVRRLDRIEARLALLERLLGRGESAEAASEAAAEPAAAPGETETPALPVAAGLPGLAGQSLLGLAAAYLLRALTENGALPPALGVALGLVYALAWLAWAARAPAAEVGTVLIRAVTSALILGPLLWEAHLRFQATTPWQTAGILVLFATLAMAISWKKNQSAVAMVGSLAGMLMSAALLVRTHDVVPYTGGLLALAAAVEVSACLEHYLGERWVVAALANLAVLLLTYVASRPAGSLEGYAPTGRAAALGAQVTLAAIYLAGTTVRTLYRGFRISAFELAQTAAALAIGVWGALTVAQGHPRAVLAAGLFCALCGLLCYLVSFAFLDRQARNDRNFYSYATFALALVLVASGLLLGPAGRTLAWALLAPGLVLISSESGRMMLKLHAGVYAVLSTVSSGLAGAAAGSFLPFAAQGAAGISPAMAIAAAGTAAGYAGLVRGRKPEACTGVYRLASFLLGGAALLSLAGWGALLAQQALGAVPQARQFRATVLTAVLAGLTVCTALGLRLWKRGEMKWLAWLLTLALTCKVVFQDLAQASGFGIVLSLALYGALLIWLPRQLR